MILELAKRFAQNGFYVFPTYKSKKESFAKPYGWTGKEAKENDPKANLRIAPTNDPAEIDTWPDQLKEKYHSELSGYGILGRGLVIFDIDVKDGKDGLKHFEEIRQKYDFPKATMIAKSKSGGYHLFFKRPKKYSKVHVKSVANLTISGTEYVGVDVRGDGGHVLGAQLIGEHEPGKYVLIKGEPETELAELPESIMPYLTASTFSNDLDNMIGAEPEPVDFMEVLKLGKLPDKVPAGARNQAFFTYLTALRNRGTSREISRTMALVLKERCEDQKDFDESVNIDDMLDRIYEVDNNNPYDIAKYLLDNGLFRLTDYRNKPAYVFLKDNPFLASKTPKELASLRELLAKHTASVTGSDGKTRQVNPADVILKQITSHHEATTLGFKPGADAVYNSRNLRLVNTYSPPYIPASDDGLDMDVFDSFKSLVANIFGEEGSKEYQLGIDFAAWFFQNPTKKPAIVPFLLSRKRGVGKSLYLNLLSRLYGHNLMGQAQVNFFNVNDISGRFFDPTGAVLNIMDEVQFDGHRNVRSEATKFWSHLKNLVTANTIRVEIKGGPTHQMDNVAGMIMAGNHADHFPVEENDRRLWIIDNQAKELKDGDFPLLFAIQNGKANTDKLINALRYGLMNHKIELQLDTMRAPMTAIKNEIMKAGMTDAQEWFTSHFEDVENLVAATPIISKSMFHYLLQVDEDLPDERWRDNLNQMFRDCIRRRYMTAIKDLKGNPRTFMNLPQVNHNGDITEPKAAKREQLYTTSRHGDFNDVDPAIVKRLYIQNLHTIKKWKKAKSAGNQGSVIDLDDIADVN